MSSRGKDFQAKQEGNTDTNKFHKAPSGSRQWRGFKNPRVVCVSRYFGGKDRHSKVCTVRGLRDRRIRLSVPTAIQLYDLQDRLGLNQPSKVVDWLLDANKQEIDKLPPLQIPPGNFTQFHHPVLLNSQESNACQSSFSSLFNPNPAHIKEGGTQPFLSGKEGIKINDHVNGDDETMMGRSKSWAPDAALREKWEEIEGEIVVGGKWITRNEQANDQGGIGSYLAQASAQNFFPIANQSSFPGATNNNMPYNFSYPWEASNLSYGSHGFSSQTVDSHRTSDRVSLASLVLPSGSQFCPPTTSLVPPLLPSMTSSMESDPAQLNQFQLLSSSSQHILPNSLMPSLHHLINNSPMKSFTYNINSEALHSQQNADQSQPDKGSKS